MDFDHYVYVNEKQRTFIFEMIMNDFKNFKNMACYLSNEKEQTYIHRLHHSPDRTIIEVDDIDSDTRIFFCLNEGTIYQVETNFDVDKICSIRQVGYLGDLDLL